MNVGEIFRSKFSEKYSDPQWKAFSAKIRREQGGFCQLCKRTDVVTQVHHWCYDKDRDPWQYTVSEVAILCKGCHEEYHKHLNDFRRFIFPRLTPRSFQVLNGALSVALKEYDGLDVAYAFAELVSNTGAIKRLSDSWKKNEHNFENRPTKGP